MCALPLISPLISFLNREYGFLPYVVILVANIGVLYEFIPLNGVKVVKRIKIEKFLIEVSSVIFICLTIFCLFYVGEATENNFPSWINYALLIYAFTPGIVTIIEIIYGFLWELKDNDDESNGNKIAGGLASEV